MKVLKSAKLFGKKSSRKKPPPGSPPQQHARSHSTELKHHTRSSSAEISNVQVSFLTQDSSVRASGSASTINSSLPSSIPAFAGVQHPPVHPSPPAVSAGPSLAHGIGKSSISAPRPSSLSIGSTSAVSQHKRHGSLDAQHQQRIHSVTALPSATVAAGSSFGANPLAHTMPLPSERSNSEDHPNPLSATAPMLLERKRKGLSKVFSKPTILRRRGRNAASGGANHSDTMSAPVGGQPGVDSQLSLSVSGPSHRKTAKFAKRFDLPETEELLKTALCAYNQHGRLQQGTLYISRNYVCFSSPIRSHPIVIPVSDMIHIKKQKTLWIPNAIEIYTNQRKRLFTSFVHRDAVFKLLASITNVPTSAVHLLGSRQLNTAASVSGTNPIPSDPNDESEDEDDEDDPLQQRLTEQQVADALVEQVVPADGILIPYTPLSPSMPALCSQLLTLEVEFPISPAEYYRTFLTERGVEFWKTTQAKFSSRPVEELTPWTLHKSESADYLERTCSFWAPLTDLMGPSHTHVHRKESLWLRGPNIFSMTHSSRMSDVPFADAWSMDTHWSVSPLPVHGMTSSEGAITRLNGCLVRLCVFLHFERQISYLPLATVENASRKASEPWFQFWRTAALERAAEVRAQLDSGELDPLPMVTFSSLYPQARLEASNSSGDASARNASAQTALAPAIAQRPAALSGRSHVLKGFSQPTALEKRFSSTWIPGVLFALVLVLMLVMIPSSIRMLHDAQRMVTERDLAHLEYIQLTERYEAVWKLIQKAIATDEQLRQALQEHWAYWSPYGGKFATQSTEWLQQIDQLRKGVAQLESLLSPSVLQHRPPPNDPVLSHFNFLLNQQK